MGLDRRELLKGALASATAGTIAGISEPARSADAVRSPSGGDGGLGQPWEVVDTNVHLFQWPFRQLPCGTTDELVGKLRSLGIKQAWAGSYEGVLHRDLGGVNERLVNACREASQGMLIPMGCVNPALPGWEDDLRKCHEIYAMPGVRLYPSYHGYALDDPRFTRLLASATERGLLLQLVVALEDRRTQHPLLQVPDVNLEPLPRILESFDKAKVMLLNYRPAGNLAAQLAKVPQIVFDTARVEGTDGITRLMQTASPQRVLHGSHAPFLVMESSLIKVYESELDREQIGSLLSGNAARLLAS